MKKGILITIGLAFIFFVRISNVYATCEIETEKASKAIVEYNINPGTGASPELKEDEYPLVNYEDVKFAGIHFEITIKNLENGIYGIISNDYDDETYTFDSTDMKNGVITYKYPSKYESVNIIVKFYGNGSNCKDRLLETDNVLLPKMNSYYETPTCKNKEYEDFDFCSPFLDKEISDAEFETSLKQYQTEKDLEVKEVENKEANLDEYIEKRGFLETNKQIILITTGLLVIIVGIIIISTIIKRRRRFK